MGSFDFAPLLRAGLPPPAAKYAGLSKYYFIGGNNDADAVPLDGLIGPLSFYCPQVPGIFEKKNSTPGLHRPPAFAP
jgi:hypothetical protein